jgi:nitric oxide reductase activation protein
MPYQEQIAAQSHVLVKSLTNVQIRTRIMAFHSLRGYTVLQMLKDYGDQDLNGVFHYTAAGWNRDSLALLAAGRLMTGEDDGTKQILLVMTDANPDDSTKMPPETGSIFDRGYGGLEGIKSTKSAVKQLKARGIHVGAVYTGPNMYVENVRDIYGADYVRVQKISQLADGISSLLQVILRTMRD